MVVYFDRGGFGGIIGRMYAGFKTLQGDFLKQNPDKVL